MESPEDPGSEPGDENIIDASELELSPIYYESENILHDWNKENYDDLMVRMYDSARTHKWCIIVLYDEPPYWQVFTYREICEIVYDENDIPIKAHAIWAKHLPLSTKFNQHDIWINLTEAAAELKNDKGENTGMGLYVNWGHDMDADIDGNDLESIWSKTVEMRYIFNDVISNSAKSSGFYWTMYGGAITTALRNEIQNVFQYWFLFKYKII